MNVPFEVFYFLGALVLGGALAYGITQAGKRNRANDPVVDKAVREQQKHPERAEQIAEEARKDLKPS